MTCKQDWPPPSLSHDLSCGDLVRVLRYRAAPRRRGLFRLLGCGPMGCKFWISKEVPCRSIVIRPRGCSQHCKACAWRSICECPRFKTRRELWPCVLTAYSLMHCTAEIVPVKTSHLQRRAGGKISMLGICETNVNSIKFY